MRIAITAASILVLAGAAAADTIKVPQDQPTIQAGIVAAATGDTVSVAKGVYYENVTIATPGITLKGVSGTILDGNIAGVDGNSLTIAAADVVVKGMTFRHGNNQIILNADGADILSCTFKDASGDGIFAAAANGATITSCKFLFTDFEAVDIIGNNNAVSKCTFTRVGSYGVRLSGIGNQVTSCTFTGLADNNAVMVLGDNAIVSKNKSNSGDLDAFRVDGATAVLESNSANRTDGRLIQVNGTGALVRKNTGKYCRGGILVVGDGAQVLTNTLSNTVAAAAIRVEGDGFTIQGNKINITWDEASGIEVENATPLGAGLIESNKVTDAGGWGFSLDSINVAMILKNTATRCGSDNTGGFRIVGDTNTFDGNKAIDSEGPGIYLENGDAIMVLNCTVKNSSTDGINVDICNDTIIDGCTVTNCGGEGIDNAGSATVLTNSKFTKNRIDLTNDMPNDGSYSGGVDTVTYETGGPTTLPEVD